MYITLLIGDSVILIVLLFSRQSTGVSINYSGFEHSLNFQSTIHYRGDLISTSILLGSISPTLSSSVYVPP